ncbi:hypothetical protein [Hyphomonas sp.]|uniref:hypothetical protein n=1 Tax=Hyphomonas sp. TaxID=87 RepID=UPI000C54EFA8|nr:hypothetical protein [Hyphomonas sp.]MAB09440.1 hypothetical protein [Hyphomonas sp.]MAU68386.1 hypothetical protein [Hyphomonas sp.]MBM59710.1 hypothetical protein [Hyphomonas sp.]
MDAVFTGLAVAGFAIALLGYAAAGLLGPPLVLPQLDFSLLTKSKGILPDLHLRGLAVTFFALTLLCAGAFWFFVFRMTTDYQDKIDTEKSAGVAPLPEPDATPVDKTNCAVSYWTDQKFKEKTRFIGLNGQELILMSKPAKSEPNLWTDEGAIVYPDGTSTRFTVGIMYGEDSWQLKSAKKIRRRRNERPVAIQTALNNTILKEIADRNDYVLVLGMASNGDNTEEPTFNLRLAHARAHNLGLTVLKLKWKEVDRIWPFTIGQSNSVVDSDELAALQRPAVLIGVIANRQVVAPDVTKATTELVTLPGLDFGDYSIPIERPLEPRRITLRSEYLDPGDINLISKPYEVRVLPAVRPEGLPEDDCSGG